ALMEALADSGSYAAALQVCRDLRLYLHRELNAQPDAATKALFEQIQSQARGLAERTRASRTEDTDASAPVLPFPRSPLPLSPPSSSAGELEPEGGAVPLDSPFYVARA